MSATGTRTTTSNEVESLANSEDLDPYHAGFNACRLQPRSRCFRCTVAPAWRAAQAKDGSFPPIDVYAEEAGDSRRDRSYTTAMCVLSLEVYYRYFTPLLLGR